MRSPSHPAPADIQLPAVFHALSDPARLRIVRDLANGQEQNCGNLSTPLAKSTLSHHLKVLREAGITHTRVDGTWRFLSLRLDDLDSRFPGLFDAILSTIGPPLPVGDQAAVIPEPESSSATSA